MSEDGAWQKGVTLRCDNCLFSTTSAKVALTHAWETGHTITGPGKLEGTIMSITLTPTEQEEP